MPNTARHCRRRLFSSSALPPLAALLLAGCVGLPAPVQESDGHTTSTPPPHSTPHSTPSRALDGATLQKDIETALQDVPDTRIAQLPEGLRFALPAADGFAAGNAHLQPALTERLQRIVPVLNRHPNTHLRIVVHTDGAGGEMHNLELTIQRAEAVMEHLRRQGIPLTRMSAEGHGERTPIADNKTPTGRASNRRIEFFLSPAQ